MEIFAVNCVCFHVKPFAYIFYSTRPINRTVTFIVDTSKHRRMFEFAIMIRLVLLAEDVSTEEVWIVHKGAPFVIRLLGCVAEYMAYQNDVNRFAVSSIKLVDTSGL